MISSPANPKVKYVKRLQAERRFRRRERAFVVEGTRWLSELAQWPAQALLILCTEQWLNTAVSTPILQQIPAPMQVVSDELMRLMSDTETAPGALAVVKNTPQPLPERPSLLLILDAIANPGNLGTMLRTAAAAGVEGVLLAPGCVDATNPKVVRGGMGAHLRLPIHQVDWSQIEQLTGEMQTWIAAADGEQTYTAVNWTTPAALTIGNEARGPGQAAQAIADGRLTIPMHAATESLNAAVAAAVILFEAARQRRQRPNPKSKT